MRVRKLLSRCTMMVLPLCLFSTPSLAETRGYVIGWFSTATYNDFQNNCPLDKNGGGLKLRLRNLIEIGYSEKDALEIINGQAVNLSPDINKRINNRAIVNGKPVPVPNYPEAVRDPMIESVTGKYAYGFTLGGKTDEAKFIDPDTNDRIDNQLWRAVGCTESYRATPPEQPYPEELSWATLIDTAPGWAIYLTGDNLDKDGSVIVTTDRLLQHLERDANGKVMPFGTYVIDPSPKSHNVFQGEIKDGILTITPSNLYMKAQHPFYLEIALSNAHMRLRHEVDGRLTGYWGGYLDWQRYAYMYTSRPANGADYIGLYHSLRRMADANPDPVTGKNRDISGTFRMEALPAYLANIDGKVIAPAFDRGTKPEKLASGQ
jgi:hypothetical protein